MTEEQERDRQVARRLLDLLLVAMERDRDEGSTRNADALWESLEDPEDDREPEDDWGVNF